MLGGDTFLVNVVVGEQLEAEWMRAGGVLPRLLDAALRAEPSRDGDRQ